MRHNLPINRQLAGNLAPGHHEVTRQDITIDLDLIYGQISGARHRRPRNMSERVPVKFASTSNCSGALSVDAVCGPVVANSSVTLLSKQVPDETNAKVATDYLMR